MAGFPALRSALNLLIKENTVETRATVRAALELAEEQHAEEVSRAADDAVRCDSLEEEVEDLQWEVDEMTRNHESAWDCAEALHREAHDRWPLIYCAQPFCVALKDALRPGWRESRPALTG